MLIQPPRAQPRGKACRVHLPKLSCLATDLAGTWHFGALSQSHFQPHIQLGITTGAGFLRHFAHWNCHSYCPWHMTNEGQLKPNSSFPVLAAVAPEPRAGTQMCHLHLLSFHSRFHLMRNAEGSKESNQKNHLTSQIMRGYITQNAALPRSSVKLGSAWLTWIPKTSRL